MTTKPTNEELKTYLSKILYGDTDFDETDRERCEVLNATLSEILDRDPATAILADLSETLHIELGSSEASGLFAQLIAAGPEASIRDELFTKVRAVDLSSSGIDRLHQTLAAAADASDGKDVPTSELRHAILDADILRLNYPEAWLPNGLAWVVYLGNDRHATRHLIQLRLAFGAWIGSISIHPLTGKSKAHERDFYVVPVSEEHLGSSTVEIRAFIESLPDGPQKSKAQTWLANIESKGAAS